MSMSYVTSPLEEKMTLEDVPNEAVLRIFKHLDAFTLINVMRVSANWNQIANSEILWRKLCFHTDRIVGNYTKDWCVEFASSHSWKECYFYFGNDELRMYTDPQVICDVANTYESDALKRKYIFSKGLDLFPESPIVLQQCADYLADRPNENDSWNYAYKFYQKALSLAEQDQEKYKKIQLFTVFRYAVFLACHRHEITEANKYYRLLLKKLPGNPWVFEKYAEFLVEYRHKYNLAEKIYRVVLNISPTGSVLISYALFLWQIRRNYHLASKCFRVACELDMNKVYVEVNFFGRHMKDEALGKDVLLQSKLYKSVQTAEDEQKVFSLALAFHQIHCVDEAEELYRKHLTMTEKVNICTLSNLAELLLHSRLKFDEAEQYYKQGLQMTSGVNDTIEVALGALTLARGDYEKGLDYLYKLVNCSHIQVSRNALAEAWILILMHAPRDRQNEALQMVKRLLVTEVIRPKLILMFDANLLWISKFYPENYKWAKLLTQVYNCEQEIESLNDWPEWESIKVDPPPTDDDEDELAHILTVDDDLGLDTDADQQGNDQH